MSIIIFTNNQIAINGSDTGLAVAQQPKGTFVYVHKTGAAINMPRTRYTLSTEAGRIEFERDILAVSA